MLRSGWGHGGRGLCVAAAEVASERRQDPGAKQPEPGERQTQVVAGGGEDGVGRVARGAGEMVALEQAVRPGVAARLAQNCTLNGKLCFFKSMHKPPFAHRAG